MAFTPQTLPEASGTLIAHWAARLESYDDDDAVGTFNAQSGTSFDAAQGTATNKPTFKTGIVNGQSVFRFDGNDYMESGAVTDWKFLHDNSEFTIYMVWATAAANPDAYIALLDTSGWASANIGCAFWCDNNSGTPASARMRLIVARGVSTEPVCDCGIDYGKVLDEFTISEVMHETGTAAYDWQIFSNLAWVSRQASNSHAPSAANSTYALNIGRRALNDFFLTGDIAEILIYTGNLSASDRLYARDHLVSLYYGVQIPRNGGLIQSLGTTYDAFGFGICDNAGNVQIFGRRGTIHTVEDAHFRRWYSDDLGASWSSVSVVDSATYDERNMAGGIIDSSGKIIVFFGRHEWDGGSWTDIKRYSSIDNGSNWNDDGTIAVGGDTTFSPHGAMITLPSGKLMQTFHGNDGTDYRLYVQFSADNGANWGNEVEIENDDTIHATEGCAVHLSGGTDGTSILLVVTRDNAGAMRQYKSTNGGTTWADQGALPFSSGAGVDVSPWLYRKDDTVYLAYMDRTRNKLLVAWGDKDAVDDSVNNWTGPIIVFGSAAGAPLSGHTGYPSMFEVGGTVVTVFYDGTENWDPDFLFSAVPDFIAAAQGDYALTGQVANLNRGLYMTAAQGSYTLTGQASNLRASRLLSAVQGSYALTGQTVNLRSGFYMTAAQGDYALTGQALNLLVSRLLVAAQGSYALTGQAMNLNHGFYMAVDQGSYTLSGQTINLLRALIMAAAQGNYALTGQTSNLLAGYLLSAAQGSYTLTGQALTLTRALIMAAIQGAYILTGQNIDLLRALILAIAQGNYALTGQSAGLLRGLIMATAQGSYALTGQSADLLAARLLAASQGGYVLTGQDAALARGFFLAAARGDYTFAGQSITLARALMMAAAQGNYTLTGQDIVLLTMIIGDPDNATYALFSDRRSYALFSDRRSYATWKDKRTIA